MKKRRVHTPTTIQMEATECGAASLSMILGYHGKFVPLEEIRVECGVSRDGSNAKNLLLAAARYRLDGEGKELTAEELDTVELPAILLWEFNHFLVLEGFGDNKVYLNDPNVGPRHVTFDEFKESYSKIVFLFYPEINFEKSGKQQGLLPLLYDRLKLIPKPFAFLFAIGMTLLIPGFGFPAFLMMFLNNFFKSNTLPWEWTFLIAVLGTVAFYGALSWAELHFLSRLNTTLSMRFSSDFLWHMLKLPIRFYDQRQGGEIAYRMTLNNTVAETLTGPVIYALINLILIFFFGIAMFFYDPLIAGISVLFGSINFLVMNRVMRSRISAFACLQQNIGKSIGQSIGGMQNIETIKVKGIESDFFSTWAGYYTKNINSTQQIEKKDIFLSTLPIFFQSTALAVLLGLGAARVISGSLSIGTLMALQILQANFLYPIGRFVSLSSQLQDMKKDLERLNDVMNNQLDPAYEARRNIPEKTQTPKLKGVLEFRDVTFRYGPLDPDVIQKVNFIIQPGGSLAIVGPSGCGKSTLAKLAAGLYLPTEGQILYDGLPLDQISIEQFRNSVASIDQDMFLFSGTIRDNLTFWNSDLPDSILIRAAKDAEIHDDISARPNGYDAPLIEEGRNLSGGQRQRLEIARAFVYNPSIMILDEATSALDKKTERAVSDHIHKRGASLLMIATRISTIEDCTEILVLNKGGNIIQRGSHEQLMGQEGLYKELAQKEAYDEAE
jgi:ATP-binding cassette subfamily C protein